VNSVSVKPTYDIAVMVVEKTALIFREFKRSTLMRTAQHQ